MAAILYKTKGNASPKDKPRVFFTCHPQDFDLHFQKVCDDIFLSHNCAVYYTQDMTEAIPPQDLETDLGSCNLVVVPVTFRLLTTPNRAMDVDIPYALRSHIPVLPIMMEAGLDDLYARPDRFGPLQYLNPCTGDLTEIAYTEKLKKYLDTVLISDEMAQRIRNAFDAYIFLSYRKKDRRYANELMRLIHSHPDCEDVAIWYDEFLTPGESFRENIDRSLRKSKLFTLLVTPNLLEEPQGKPNFIMGVEYPAAREAGLEILPAEMEATDKAALNQKFQGIPNCVDPRDSNVLATQLLKAVTRIATTANDDPTHNFLIGLAYLDGIDVEVNRERALKLITSAAEAELPEAMEKLFTMYHEGIGVALDYRKELVWIQRLVDYATRVYGKEHKKTLVYMNRLAITHRNLGNYQTAAEILEQVFTLRRKVLGLNHPETVRTHGILASTYNKLGKYQKALEINEGLYSLNLNVLGEEHPFTVQNLNNLASTHYKLGHYEKAQGLFERCYQLSCQVHGEEDPSTLKALGNLAVIYIALENHTKAAALLEESYRLHCKVHGEQHPDTLNALSNLADCYCQLENYEKAIQTGNKAYDLTCQVLGKDHPDSLVCLGNLAFTYHKMGSYAKAAELEEYVWHQRCKLLGEAHPDTLQALSNYALTLDHQGSFEKAAELGEQAYVLNKNVIGQTHPKTYATVLNLVTFYQHMGDFVKARELQETVYALSCKLLGQTHPKTLTALCNLAVYCGMVGDHAREQALAAQAYVLNRKVWGESHPETLTSLNNLAIACYNLGEYGKMLELSKDAYEKRAKVLGQAHPHTLISLDTLAYAYAKTRDLNMEAACYSKLYELRKQALGESHPDTQKALQNSKAATEKIAARQQRYRQKGLCQHCGGQFEGFLAKKCALCGKKKDY